MYILWYDYNSTIQNCKENPNFNGLCTISLAAVSHPDLEDGETDPVLVKYKPEKLVSFPGFNDPMPHRTREVCKLFFFCYAT